MSVSQVNSQTPKTTEIVQYFPEEIIYELTKHINTLSGIRALSLVSQHFFQVIFSNEFPRWSALLMLHFPFSFQMTTSHLKPMDLYQNLKAIDHNMRIGTYQTCTLVGHEQGVS
ncbi:MAG: hypothetical protein AB7H48_05995, partial [Parachlamydiales bacterium]